MKSWMGLAVVASVAVVFSAVVVHAETPMTFFVTSVGLGNGANLGGLDGADKHCQSLAAKAGAGKHTWHAYLSTQGAKLNDPNVVNARDRIGNGPWHNAKGVMVAKNVEDLHSANNNLTKETALSEKGEIVNGRTDKPNRHDMLTGSRPDGTAYAPSPLPDMTCGNWTKGGAARCWVTMTGRDRSITRGPCPGTPRTHRSAAARRHCRKRAAMAYSTALL